MRFGDHALAWRGVRTPDASISEGLWFWGVERVGFRGRTLNLSIADSVRWATVLMTSTALKGNEPYAVSPDSITASAPSRTAMAMSDTCLRRNARCHMLKGAPLRPITELGNSPRTSSSAWMIRGACWLSESRAKRPCFEHRGRNCILGDAGSSALHVRGSHRLPRGRGRQGMRSLAAPPCLVSRHDVFGRNIFECVAASGEIPRLWIAVRSTLHRRTSARVGVGLAIMDSSMLVATITGLPRLRHPCTMRLCQYGTCAPMPTCCT